MSKYTFTKQQVRKGNERLLKLIRTINPQSFEMCDWLNVGNNENVSTEHLLKDLKEGSCGTSACLAGWAPIAFPELIKLKGTSDNFMIKFTPVKGKKRRVTRSLSVAAQEILYLTDTEAEFLFSTFYKKIDVMEKIVSEFVDLRYNNDCQNLSSAVLGLLDIKLRYEGII